MRKVIRGAKNLSSLPCRPMMTAEGEEASGGFVVCYESIGGTADGSSQAFEAALDRAVNMYSTATLGKHAYVVATFESDVVFRAMSYGESDSGELSTYRCAFESTEKEGAYSFTFSALRHTRQRVEFVDVNDGSEQPNGDPLTFTVAESAWTPVGEPMQVHVAESLDETREVSVMEAVYESADGKRHVVLSGRVAFESSPEETRKRFEETGVVRGRVPFADIGKFTANDNDYTEKFAAHLETDVKRLITSLKSGKLLEVQSPWPPLVMYASHMPAKGPEGPERFQVTSQITGIVREGNWLYATFETTRNTAGRDLAILMLDVPWVVPAVSLRGLISEATANERGGSSVDRVMIETFGIDWTNLPAMPGVKEKGVVLESEASGERKGPGGDADKEIDLMKIKNLKALLEALQKDNATLYAEVAEAINGGTKVDALVAKLRAAGFVVETEESAPQKTEVPAEVLEARKVLTENAVGVVVGAVTEKLKADQSLTDIARANIGHEVRESAQAAALRITSERPELSPSSQGFRDALTGAVEPLVESRVDAAKALIAEARKGATFGAPPAPGTYQMEGEHGTAFSAPNISTPDARMMLLESQNEEVGLPTGKRDAQGNAVPPPLKDVLLAKAFQMPMYESSEVHGGKVHVIQKHAPAKWALLQEMAGKYDHRQLVLREGAQYPLTDRFLTENQLYAGMVRAIRNREPLNETAMQVAATIGTLFPDIRQAIIEAAFFMSSWMTFATVENIESDTFKVYEESYTREGRLLWGVGAHDTAFTNTNNEGAAAYADDVWIVLTEAMSAHAATLVLTGVNQNDVATATWTCTIPASAAIGTYIQMRPSVVGDRCKHITAGAITTSATTGEWIVFSYDQVDAGAQTELVVSGTAKVSISPITATVQELDLAAEIGWRLIEDANKSLAMYGPGAYNVAARLVALISEDLRQQVDRRGFGGLNNSTNHDTTNDVTFNVTEAGRPTGYTDAEWKATLHETLFKLGERIHDWSKKNVNRLAISRSDTHKLLWMKHDLLRPLPERAESFFMGREWGTVAGMMVVPADFQPGRKMMAADRQYVGHHVYIPLEFRGPFSYHNSQKTDIYVGRQRSADSYVQLKSRGAVTITE